MSQAFTHKKMLIHYDEYLTHKDEPKEETLNDRLEGAFGIGLIRSCFYHKLRFRRTARRLRGDA